MGAGHIAPLPNRTTPNRPQCFPNRPQYLNQIAPTVHQIVPTDHQIAPTFLRGIFTRPQRIYIKIYIYQLAPTFLRGELSGVVGFRKRKGCCSHYRRLFSHHFLIIKISRFYAKLLDLQ